MKHLSMLSILSILLSISCQLIAAPSTPITRGRLTTDLDAAGHSITNGPMATTNFVWEVVGAVTNNLPSGGMDGGAVTNIVEGILTGATNGMVKVEDGQVLLDDAEISASAATLGFLAVGDLRAGGSAAYYGGEDEDHELAVKADIASCASRTNLPPLSASATVGDLVDRLNEVIGALR